MRTLGVSAKCSTFQNENIFIEADASQILQEPKTLPGSVATPHRVNKGFTNQPSL